MNHSINLLTSLLPSSKYVSIHVEIAKILGIEGAMLLADFIDRYGYLEANENLCSHPEHGDGLMYYTHSWAWDKCAIEEKPFRAIIKKFQELEFIQVYKFGVPCKNYYRLDLQKIAEYLSKNLSRNPKQGNWLPQTGQLETPIGVTNNNNINTIPKEKQQQHQAPPPDAAAVFSELEKEEKPIIYPSLRGLKIPIEDQLEITKKYPLEVVYNAVKWSLHPDNPPNKCLAAQIKFACKKGLSLESMKKKTSETPYEKVKKIFKNGEIYNNAECFLKSDGIAFVRGMRNNSIKFDQYFSWKKFEELCESFQIETIKEKTT